MHKFFLIMIVLFLTGCPNPAVIKQYPTELSSKDFAPRFPYDIAGFRRWKILTYAPGMKDYSVGYNHNTLEAQIASTIYFRESKENFEAMFEFEKQTILNSHQDAEILAIEKIVFSKSGVKFNALRATFKYKETFSMRYQELFSQLMLWKGKNKLLKLRSTSPQAHKEQNLTKNLSLLDALDWNF